MHQKLMKSMLSLCLVSFCGALSGCTDFGADPPQTENLIISVKASHTHSSLGKVLHENLVINSVKVLLQDIRLKAGADGDSLNIASGPIGVETKLDGNFTVVAASLVPAGRYAGLSMSIHRPDEGENVSDAEFKGGQDGVKRFSVIVRGEYHETPFMYMSPIDVRLALSFDHAVQVPTGGTVHITVDLDPHSWFDVNGLLLDPFNQGKEIDENVARTFGRAYQDNNRDGEPD